MRRQPLLQIGQRFAVFLFLNVSSVAAAVLDINAINAYFSTRFALSATDLASLADAASFNIHLKYIFS